MTEHKSLASALAAAQMEMGKALKSASNPHFKSKYADLSSVVDACLPALNAHGIAVIQPMTDDETGRYVTTSLIHGASGETLSCRVPLILGKNDMQGYGSAVTYARRYGLMSMAGIAPEDDDGNAAAKNAPTTAQRTQVNPTKISADQFVRLKDKVEEWGGDENKFLAGYNAQSLEKFPLQSLAAALTALQTKIDAAAPPPPMNGKADPAPDFIPY